MRNDVVTELTKPAVMYFFQEEVISKSSTLLERLALAVDDAGLVPQILDRENDYNLTQAEVIGIEIPRVGVDEIHGSAIEAWGELLFHHLQSEHARSVDNFLSFLSDSLRSLFEADHRTLHSYADKEIRLEQVLRCSDRAELLSEVAEQIVSRASYAGVKDIVKLFQKHGVDVRLSDDELQGVVEAKAIRNIIVHNRGVVNDVFLSTVTRKVVEVTLPSGALHRSRGFSLPTELTKGDLFPFDWSISGNYRRLLWRVVLKFDATIRQKFKVCAEPIPQSICGLVHYASGNVLDALKTPSSSLSPLRVSDSE